MSAEGDASQRAALKAGRVTTKESDSEWELLPYLSEGRHVKRLCSEITWTMEKHELRESVWLNASTGQQNKIHASPVAAFPLQDHRWQRLTWELQE